MSGILGIFLKSPGYLIYCRYFKFKCIFNHLRWVNFKIFSNNGGQLNKCIFSHLTWPMTNWCLFPNRVYEWYFMLFLCLNWLNFDCPVVQSYLSPYCFEVMMNFKRTLNLSFSRCWKCYIWPPRPLTWPALPLEKAFPCYFKSGYLLLVRDMSGIYVWIWVATIRLVFYLVHIFNLIYIDRHILFFL